jgi:hypothetical protein
MIAAAAFDGAKLGDEAAFEIASGRARHPA